MSILDNRPDLKAEIEKTAEVAGYLWQNGKKTIVSGGSVSGNMQTLCKNMRMSKKQRQYDTLLIPALTRLAGVQVTGV